MNVTGVQTCSLPIWLFVGVPVEIETHLARREKSEQLGAGGLREGGFIGRVSVAARGEFREPVFAVLARAFGTAGRQELFASAAQDEVGLGAEILIQDSLEIFSIRH